MRLQHLAGDLRIPRLVGAHKAELVASKRRNQAIKQKKSADEDQQNQFDERGPERPPEERAESPGRPCSGR